MATLRVDSIRLTEEFAEHLGALGLPGPWEVSTEEPGNIHARDGQYVCTLDVNHDVPDSVVIARATAIVIAVNTCAGFRAVREGS